MTSPDRDPERKEESLADARGLERLLRAALHAEAARATPAGDGLARIRARTATRAGFGRLFRPALAGAALTFTLIAGTLLGLNATGDGGRTQIAQPAASGGPVAVAPPPAVGQPPLVEVNPPAPSAAPTAEARIAVTAPPTGFASPAATCIPDTSVPADDGGTYVAITSPGSGCPLKGSSFTVSGKARIFEAALSIDVTQNNTVLHTANVSASEGAPGLGTWSTMFSLPPGNYRIEAYGLSPEDGSRYVSDTIWISVR